MEEENEGKGYTKFIGKTVVETEVGVGRNSACSVKLEMRV